MLLAAVAASRDRAAFAELFARYAPRLKGHLMARGASDAIADELTQDVMHTVWHKAAQFDRTKGSVGAWLFAIVRNTFANHQRRRRPEPETENTTQIEDAPDELLVLAESQQRLRVAMTALPAEQLAALDGVYYRGRTLQELAIEQGIPLGTAKTRIRLALSRLRDSLAGRDEDGDR